MRLRVDGEELYKEGLEVQRRLASAIEKYQPGLDAVLQQEADRALAHLRQACHMGRDTCHIGPD
jgi:hypothetical protein